MPYLGDFIGHLIAELTISRMQADIESMRIAELYANHPLLKHFAVPRFRLPNVTINVPIAILDMEEVPKGKGPAGGLSRMTKLTKTIDETIRSNLSRAEVKLSEEKHVELQNNLQKIMENMTRIKEVPVNLSYIADKLATEVTRSISQADAKRFAPDSEEVMKIQRQLQFAIRQDLLQYMESPPRLRVLVSAKDLIEIKEPDCLVRLNLTISEEGLEWTVIETNGKAQDRLVPE